MLITLDITALPEQLRQAVADLVEKRGPDRPLTHADLREVESAADQLRRAYQEGEAEDLGAAAAHLDAIVGIPGAALHRPTYGARIRLLQADAWPIPAAWAKYPGEWTNLAAAFILAHARDPEVLAALVTPTQAALVIEAWGAALPATCSEVAAAVRTLTDGAYPSLGEGEKKKGAPGQKPSPPYSVFCATRRAAPPTTGSGKSPSPTSPGCSASLSGSTDSPPPPPATAPPPPSTPPTPGSAPSNAGAFSPPASPPCR